jgi:hypothetical protein
MSVPSHHFAPQRRRRGSFERTVSGAIRRPPTCRRNSVCRRFINGQRPVHAEGRRYVVCRPILRISSTTLSGVRSHWANPVPLCLAPANATQPCYATLPTHVARVWNRRQIVDVPAFAFEVIQHRALVLKRACGQLRTSSLPAGVSKAVQYGPDVRALGVHLTPGQMLLPHARAAELTFDLYSLAGRCGRRQCRPPLKAAIWFSCANR